MENMDRESEIRSELHSDDIAGDGQAVRRLIKAVETVAPSDSEHPDPTTRTAPARKNSIRL